jgi:hypothetical protein
MGGDELNTVIVQFAVDGLGTDEEFDRRCQIEDLLDQALKGSGNGFCDGGDSGSGSMNIFLMVKDVKRAVPFILDTLRKSDLLNDCIVAESLREDDEVVGHKVWWPETFTGRFSVI